MSVTEFRRVAVRYWTCVRDAWARFDTDNGWSKASHVALSMMLALFPFCIFVLSLAGQFSAELRVADLIDFVYGSWPEEIAEPITREVEAVLHQSGAGTMTFGALLAVFFASNGIDAVRVVVTDAYLDHDPRPAWRTRLLCIGFVLFGALLLILGGTFVVGLPLYFRSVYETAPDLYAAVFFNNHLGRLISMGLLFFSLFACHVWLPGVHRPTRTVLPGIVLTILLWLLAGQAFAFYLKNFSSYSVTYAGLSGVMAALVFMYVMAAIFVLGAEFNGRLEASRKDAEPSGDSDAERNTGRLDDSG